MNLTELYIYAEERGIPVTSFDMPKSKSMSILYDGNCYIGIDPFAIKSEWEEKVKLAHEIGHCETGSFYNEYAVCDIRSQHERRADVWAIKKLVPEDELKQAIEYGYCRNRYELSEYFGVTEDFMQKVLDYYMGEN